MTRFVWLMAVVCIAMPVGGCTSKAHPDPVVAPGPQLATVEVSYSDLLNQKQIQRDVSLGSGGTLRIVLGTNASTGYKWTADAAISDSRVLTQAGHVAVAAPNAMPGGSGTEVWTFTAVNPGTAAVTTTYGQPWPGGEQGAWTFTANVTVI